MCRKKVTNSIGGQDRPPKQNISAVVFLTNIMEYKPIEQLGYRITLRKILRIWFRIFKMCFFGVLFFWNLPSRLFMGLSLFFYTINRQKRGMA